MKSTEQIATAESLIDNLTDYVTLAKTEKKLKLDVNKNTTNNMISDIVTTININVKEL